jgi:hypothetical protein
MYPKFECPVFRFPTVLTNNVGKKNEERKRKITFSQNIEKKWKIKWKPRNENSAS